MIKCPKCGKNNIESRPDCIWCHANLDEESPAAAAGQKTTQQECDDEWATWYAARGKPYSRGKSGTSPYPPIRPRTSPYPEPLTPTLIIANVVGGLFMLYACYWLLHFLYGFLVNVYFFVLVRFIHPELMPSCAMCVLLLTSKGPGFRFSCSAF